MHKKNYPFLPTVSDWFDDFFQKDLDVFSKFKSTVPSVNVKEVDKFYIIELAAPGLTKADFDINIDNNIITISSGSEQKEEDTNENYTKREFCYSAFKRAFTLPDTANPEDIDAKYENGILEITITKKEEAQVKPKRKINIK